MRRTAILAALALVASSLAIPAIAQEDLRIESKPSPFIPGQYRFSIRNIGSETLTIEGGQLNGRDDCMIVPATTHTDATPMGGSADIVEHHLSSVAELKAVFEGRNDVKLLYAPFEMRVGESADLGMAWSPCSENGSEVVQVVIRTSHGEYSFSK